MSRRTGVHHFWSSSVNEQSCRALLWGRGLLCSGAGLLIGVIAQSTLQRKGGSSDGVALCERCSATNKALVSDTRGCTCETTSNGICVRIYARYMHTTGVARRISGHWFMNKPWSFTLPCGLASHALPLSCPSSQSQCASMKCTHATHKR